MATIPFYNIISLFNIFRARFENPKISENSKKTDYTSKFYRAPHIDIFGENWYYGFKLICELINEIFLHKWRFPMNIDMTQGATMKSMLRFALPMILGNLLQQ